MAARARIKFRLGKQLQEAETKSQGLPEKFQEEGTKSQGLPEEFQEKAKVSDGVEKTQVIRQDKAEGSDRRRSESDDEDNPFSLDALMLKYHNKVRVLAGHGGETWELAPAKSASASPSRSSAPSGLQPEVPTVEKKKRQSRRIWEKEK